MTCSSLPAELALAAVIPRVDNPHRGDEQEQGCHSRDGDAVGIAPLGALPRYDETVGENCGRSWATQQHDDEMPLRSTLLVTDEVSPRPNPGLDWIDEPQRHESAGAHSHQRSAEEPLG